MIGQTITAPVVLGLRGPGLTDADKATLTNAVGQTAAAEAAVAGQVAQFNQASAGLATRASLSVTANSVIGRPVGAALVTGTPIFQAAFFQRDPVQALGTLSTVDVFDLAASANNMVGVYRSTNGAAPALVASTSFTTTGAKAYVQGIALAQPLAVQPGDILGAATPDASYPYTNSQADGAGYIFGSGPGLPQTITSNDIVTGDQIQFRFNVVGLVQTVNADSFSKIAGAGLTALVTDGRTLSGWRAKLATLLSTGTGLVRMLATGDSWTEHLPIATAFANLFYAGPNPIAAKAGDGYISANALSGSDGPPIGTVVVARTGGWQLYDASNGGNPPAVGCGLDGQAIYTTNSTDTVTITGVTCTAFTIWYAKASGTFSYRVDGGAWTVVKGDGSNALGVVTIAGLALAAHEIDINTTGNTGTAAILGFYASTSANGIEYWKAGNGGSTGSNFSLFADNFITPMASQFPPDLVMIILTTNDITIPGQTPAAMIAGIAKTIAAYRRANPQCGFILVSPAQAVAATDKLPRAAYRDAIYAFAVQNGCEFYNMNDDWDVWTVENARGQWNPAPQYNAFHISNIGAYRMAARINSKLLRL